MNGFWRKVRHWSRMFGDFQARLILTLLYAILVLPTGLIARIGGDLLESSSQERDSYWRTRAFTESSVRAARGQG